MESPCVKPILRLPCVTTFESAVGIGKLLSPAAAPAWPGEVDGCEVVSGMSKSPLTSCKSGASWRRKA